MYDIYLYIYVSKTNLGRHSYHSSEDRSVQVFLVPHLEQLLRGSGPDQVCIQALCKNFHLILIGSILAIEQVFSTEK